MLLLLANISHRGTRLGTRRLWGVCIGDNRLTKWLAWLRWSSQLYWRRGIETFLCWPGGDRRVGSRVWSRNAWRYSIFLPQKAPGGHLSKTAFRLWENTDLQQHSHIVGIVLYDLLHVSVERFQHKRKRKVATKSLTDHHHVQGTDIIQLVDQRWRTSSCQMYELPTPKRQRFCSYKTKKHCPVIPLKLLQYNPSSP